jgi:hypothetical protein
MPVHGWTRVEACIFHDFHHGWIGTLAAALNSKVLPADYYALITPQEAIEPDVVAGLAEEAPSPEHGPRLLSTAVHPPRVRLTAEAPLEFYRRNQSTVAVHRAGDDRVVAEIRVVSPGNKASRGSLRSFVEKAGELLDRRIHLLVIDLLPPTKRDPHGIHAAVWEEVSGEEFVPPPDKPLTLAAYESGLTLRAYVEPVAVGDALADVPLFLEPGAHVLVPLEATYATAWQAVPRRWRAVLEQAGPPA